MSKPKIPVPSDDMIVLAALLSNGTDWQYAKSIASVLRQLGFEISPQKMVGMLRRLLAEEHPMFECRPHPWGDWSEYRVTGWALARMRTHFWGARLWVRELRRGMAE